MTWDPDLKWRLRALGVAAPSLVGEIIPDPDKLILFFLCLDVVPPATIDETDYPKVSNIIDAPNYFSGAVSSTSLS